jgi:hypothetical protein
MQNRRDVIDRRFQHPLSPPHWQGDKAGVEAERLMEAFRIREKQREAAKQAQAARVEQLLTGSGRIEKFQATRTGEHLPVSLAVGCVFCVISVYCS